jgi:hypothetical protein
MVWINGQGMCEICLLPTNKLHIHHVTPKRYEIPTYGLELPKKSDIIEICGYCHWEIHCKDNVLPKKLRPIDYNEWASKIDKEAIKLLEQYKMQVLKARNDFYRYKKERKNKILNTKY